MQNEGLSIGLFGGSFNPAHAGHMHVAKCGLNRLRLDRIWWMVSPQNPLKDKQPSYDSRVATVDALGLPFQMRISHMERDFGTQYTIDTLKQARRRWPQTNFVFLMGADNFAQLPLWKDWQGIMKTLPVAVIARPSKSGSLSIKPRLGRAARTYAQSRIPENAADTLKYQTAPAWTYLTPPLNSLSSTRLRALKS